MQPVDIIGLNDFIFHDEDVYGLQTHYFFCCYLHVYLYFISNDQCKLYTEYASIKRSFKMKINKERGKNGRA